MIANIIEESYQNKNKTKKVININYDGPKEPFHDIEEEKINSSTTMNIKIKKTEKKINEDIDDLLVFSLVDDEEKNKESTLQKFKFGQVKTPTIRQIKNRVKKKNKYLFKGDLSMSEKINKTKIKEFSFSKTTKNKKKRPTYINFHKESRNKNSSRSKIKNILTPFHPMSAKSTVNPIKYYNIGNSDCFFITKLPSYYKNYSNLKSKENKLKKMRKLIKETNSTMLDIYTGLKNMKQNKFSTYDEPLSNDQKRKYKKGFKNADKLNIGMKRIQSASYINRQFRKIFHSIYDNKKFSNEKLDARTLLDPLEKITGGTYKEVKIDNIINNEVGQRIWIKKSTANIVSYGKSFQLISDDIFYKERKRIIGIYPKIERDAEILIPFKKVKKNNFLLKRLKDNVQKLNDVYLNEHKLISRVKRKYA